jgi:hypothetical protein
MKYEVEIYQVTSEVVTVEADNEQEAMNIAGQVIHEGDYYFDGMPEYKMNVRQVVNNKEVLDDK